MVKTIGFVLVLALTLAVKGCGKSSDGEGGNGGRVSIDPFSKKVKVTGDDGETKGEIGEGVKIPADFPKDVPAREIGKVIASIRRGNAFHLTVMTKTGQQKVVDDYRAKMRADGWTEQQTMDLGVAKMVHFKKGNRMVSVSATATDEGTTVSITTQQEEKEEQQEEE